MKSLDVTTAHNIVINVTTAGVFSRVLACILDYLILLSISYIFILVFSFSSILVNTTIFMVTAFYHLFFELFNKGQSIGKALLKIKVVSLRGGSPTIEESLLRWAFRLVDVIGSLGGLAFIFAISTEKNQRIGDILAQTTVIKTTSDNQTSLTTILNLNQNTDSAIIKYPALKEFTDDDFLLIKQAINRYSKNDSHSNREIVNRLAFSLAERVDVDIKNTNRIEFLKELLLEYIKMTR